MESLPSRGRFRRRERDCTPGVGDRHDAEDSVGLFGGAVTIVVIVLSAIGLELGLLALGFPVVAATGLVAVVFAAAAPVVKQAVSWLAGWRLAVRLAR